MPSWKSPTSAHPGGCVHPAQQKVICGAGPEKKILIYDVRNRYVYENTRNIDKMSDEKSDILGKVKPILPKILHLHGQFPLDFGFRGVFGADV